MGPHSLGPQEAGYVSSSFNCFALTSAAAARAPKCSASPAPLHNQPEVSCLTCTGHAVSSLTCTGNPMQWPETLSSGIEKQLF